MFIVYYIWLKVTSLWNQNQPWLENCEIKMQKLQKK